MKRLTAALLALTLLLGAMPFASAEGSMANFTPVREPIAFADVQESDWFFADVQATYALGLMSGTGAETFAPSGTLTAAEAVAMACRIRSIYEADGAAFEQGSPWYQVYWDYALEKKIIADGLLEPTKPITREQFAYVMCGALPSAEYPVINEIEDDTLPDVIVQTTYGGFVYRLYRAGVVTGNRYGRYLPADTLRRSEAAAITVRIAQPEQRRFYTPEPTPAVEEIVLAGKTEIRPGATTQWTAKLLPDFSESEVTWSAGNPGVATVDEQGVITAHKLGDCHITATAANGVKKTGLLHVVDSEKLFLRDYPNAVVLASYDSPHTAIAPRTNNLILACAAINGTVLEPDEVFSFNKIVGERTAEKGYKEATVYAEGGASEPALGGGVCQVASTIYMCALLADLKIEQRTEHMYAVTYVPLGMDATIYWGSLDFKFRNSTSHPMLIRASVSGGKVHIQLVGIKDWDYTVKMSYEVLETIPYSTTEQLDSTKEAGYRSVSVTPYTGYRVVTYKERIDANGKSIEKVRCASSSYRKRDQVVIVGPEKVETPQPTTPTRPTRPTRPR